MERKDFERILTRTFLGCDMTHLLVLFQYVVKDEVKIKFVEAETLTSSHGTFQL
jgi:hypothetical protein